MNRDFFSGYLHIQKNIRVLVLTCFLLTKWQEAYKLVFKRQFPTVRNVNDTTATNRTTYYMFAFSFLEKQKTWILKSPILLLKIDLFSWKSNVLISVLLSNPAIQISVWYNICKP